MSGSAINIRIGAVDTATGVIDKINARIERFTGAFQKRFDEAAAPVRRMQASLAKFGDVSGLNRVTEGVRGLGRAGTYTAGKLNELIPLVGIIGSAASIAGVQRMVSSYAEWGLKVSNTARQIGVGTRQLTGLEGAANLAGGSADAMASGMQNLGQSMYDAVGGRNTEAVVMFRTLGVAFQDGAGKARKASDVLPEIADRIKAIKDPFARAQVGVTLFGGAWAGIEPLMRLGGQGVRELTEKAERYNYVTDQTADNGAILNLAFREVTEAAGGLATRISDRLAPVITPMLKHFADWLATSPAITKAVEWLGNAVEKLGDWIEHINWDKVGEKLDAWGERIKVFLGWAAKLGLIPDIGGAGGGGSGPNTPAPGAAPDKTMHPGESSGAGNMVRNIAREWNPFHWTPDYHPAGKDANDLRLGAEGKFNTPGDTRSRDWMRDHPMGARNPALMPGAVPDRTDNSWAGDLKQLMGYGWSAQKAAGILGNLSQESEGSTNIVGGWRARLWAGPVA